MPIYDINELLPICTPIPEDKAYLSKPILVLVTSFRLNQWNKYFSLIHKLQRETRLLCVSHIDDLDETIDKHASSIAGFIVTDGAVMDPAHEALAHRLATLVEDPEHEWAVVFAFAFPHAAASDPQEFSLFMHEVFGLRWYIDGTSGGKVALRLRERTLRKLGERVYRPHFYLRAVFLRGVKRADKLLLACEEVEYGLPEGVGKWTLWHQTPDMNEGVVFDDEESDGYMGDDDLETDVETDADAEADIEDEYNYNYILTDHVDGDESIAESEWVPSDDEGTEEDKYIADCPVAVHEVKTWNATEDGEEMGKGYVAFVGHVDDSRSMSSLILGICGVE